MRGWLGTLISLADVVAERGDDHLVVGAGPLGQGGGLQAVGELVDGEPVGDVGQRRRAWRGPRRPRGAGCCIVSAPITAHCSAVDSSMRVKLSSCHQSAVSDRPDAAAGVSRQPASTSAATAARSFEPPARSGTGLAEAGTWRATSRLAASRSRSSRGGGKYSSSSVTRHLLHAVAGASRATTASTSASGAEAPAVTPTVPDRSSGSSAASLTR